MNQTNSSKGKILNCALELFASQGYENTSLDQIAKHAKLTKGAIYWNFKNKEDLFITLFENEIKKYLNHIQFRTRDITDPVKLLETIFKENCNYYLSTPNFCKISHLVLTNKKLNTNEKIQGFTAKIQNDLYLMLKNAFEEGIFTKKIALNATESLISTFGVILDGIMLQIIFDQQPESIRKAVDTTWSIFIKGIKEMEDEVVPKTISLAFQPEEKI